MLSFALVGGPSLFAAGDELARVEVARQLRAAIGREVTFGGLHFGASGLALEDVSLGAGRGPALHVRRVLVETDWTSLLHGSLRVRRLEFDGADLAMAPASLPSSPSQAPWPEQFLAQARSMGLERIDVRDASVSLDDAQVGRWHVDRLVGSVRVKLEGFAVEGRATSVRRGDAELRDVAFSGQTIGAIVSVPQIVAHAFGGALSGTARYDVTRGALRSSLRVRNVAIPAVSAALGAKNFAPVEGMLDGELIVDADHDAFSRASGSLRVRDGVVLDASRRWAAEASMFLEATSERVKLSGIHAASDDLHADADLVFLRANDRNGAPWMFRTTGRLDANGPAIMAVAARVGGAPLLTAHWNARHAALSFEAHGPLDTAMRVEGAGHLHLDGLSVRPAPQMASLEIRSLDTDITPSSHGVRFAGIRAALPGFSVSGDLALRGPNPMRLDRFVANATVSVSDVAELRRLAPSSPAWHVVSTGRDTRARVELHATGALSDRTDRVASASWSVTNVRVGAEVRLPDHSLLNIPVTRASGRFEYAGRAHGDRFVVRDVRIESPMGTLVGSAERDGTTHHLAFTGTGVHADPLHFLLPGTVRGGLLDGTVEITGDERQPARVAMGRFELTQAQYILPRELNLSAAPITIQNARGNYRWEASHSTVTSLELRTDYVNGRGDISIAHGVTSVRGEVSSNDVGHALTIWPSLATLLRGSRATGHLVADIDAHGAVGTLNAQGEGGSIRLPEAPADLADQPVSQSDVRLAFSPTQIVIESLALRGPKSNLDLHSTWSFDGGPVRGGGRVWLSRSYSHQLLIGWNWLAHIFGVRALESTFALDGTSNHPLFHAGIIHTPLWHLGEARIPRRVRDLASGRTSL